MPDETRAELERLVERYSLVACVSGRTSEDAERIVGVPGVVYVGSHGLELAPEAEEWREPPHRFGAERRLAGGGQGADRVLPLPRRGRRGGCARERLEQVAEAARAQGLLARFGRKVLELRPPIEADKGTAVQALLVDRGLRRALYAGDDTTDLDGFRGLDGLEARRPRGRQLSGEGPRNCARPPTWWSTAPLERSSCCGRSRPLRAPARASSSSTGASRSLPPDDTSATSMPRRRPPVPAQMNAASKPSVSATDSGEPEATASPVVEVAIAESAAMPSAPPICCDVLNSPEASPASSSGRRRAPRSRSARTRSPARPRSAGTRAGDRRGTTRRPRPA